MKKQLIVVLLSIIATYAAETPIDLSNANNDLLSLFLSEVPAEHPLISELTRTRNCNSDLYDRLIEAYLQKLDLFYIEEKDIKSIIDQRFSISANNKIKNEIYRRKINAAFMRYIAKYPYYYIIKHIEYNKLDDSLFKHIKIALKYYYHCASMPEDKFMKLTQEQVIEFSNELKKEKKIINNLRLFIGSNEERILYKISSKSRFTIELHLILDLIGFIFSVIILSITHDKSEILSSLLLMAITISLIIVKLIEQCGALSPNSIRITNAKLYLDTLTIFCTKCNNNIDKLLKLFDLLLINIDLRKKIDARNKLVLTSTK